MLKIDWRGNSGYLFPDPGKVEYARCGVCNSKMKAVRNVFGPTSFVMAIAGRKRLHDSFFYPNYNKDWHERIYRLKIEVYIAQIDRKLDFKKRKKAARKEIIKLLKKHRPR